MSRFRTDLLRLLSMTMVLAIHATGPYEFFFLSGHDYFSQDFLAVILNQLARFSVPVFVALSGFGLTMKYGLQTQGSGKSLEQLQVPVLPFYRDRLYKIGIPFLFWSLLYLAVQGKFKGPYDEAWLLDLLPYLYRTGADYHFYFFHIIFECYLVFPAVLWLFSRLGKLRTPVLILSLALQLYVSSPAHIWWADYPRIPFVFSAFFLYWQFPLCLGIFFGLKHLEDSSQTKPDARGNRWLLVAGSALSFLVVLAEYVFWSYRGENPGDFNHFTRMSVILYSSAFFLLFYYWPRSEDSTANPESKKTENRISYLAGLSFFVYIVHTWILRGLQIVFPEWMLLVLVVLVLVSFSLAALLDGWITIPWMRNLMGLEKKRASKQ